MVFQVSASMLNALPTYWGLTRCSKSGHVIDTENKVGSSLSVLLVLMVQYIVRTSTHAYIIIYRCYYYSYSLLPLRCIIMVQYTSFAERSHSKPNYARKLYVTINTEFPQPRLVMPEWGGSLPATHHSGGRVFHAGRRPPPPSPPPSVSSATRRHFTDEPGIKA